MPGAPRAPLEELHIRYKELPVVYLPAIGGFGSCAQLLEDKRTGFVVTCTLQSDVGNCAQRLEDIRTGVVILESPLDIKMLLEMPDLN
jgi:hypothetical protein